MVWLPDSRLEAPELLEPGRKPVGPVTLNKHAKWADHLKVFELMDGHQEIVSGDKWEIGSTVKYGVDNGQQCYIPNGVYTGGTNYKQMPEIDYRDWPGFTIIAHARMPEYVEYDGIYSSVRSGDFYGNVNLSAEYTRNIQLRVGNWFEGAITPVIPIHSDFVVAGSWDKSIIRIYSSTDIRTPIEYADAISQTVDWDVPSPENYIGYYSRGDGRSWQSNIYWVMVFDKKLELSEMREIIANPYQFLIPA